MGIWQNVLIDFAFQFSFPRFFCLHYGLFRLIRWLHETSVREIAASRENVSPVFAEHARFVKNRTMFRKPGSLATLRIAFLIKGDAVQLDVVVDPLYGRLEQILTYTSCSLAARHGKASGKQII